MYDDDIKLIVFSVIFLVVLLIGCVWLESYGCHACSESWWKHLLRRSEKDRYN